MLLSTILFTIIRRPTFHREYEDQWSDITPDILRTSQFRQLLLAFPG